MLPQIMELKNATGGLQPTSLQQGSVKVNQLLTSVRQIEESIRPFYSLGQQAASSEMLGKSEKLDNVEKRCEALKHQAETFENIVCVLNREVERASVSMAAYEQQHKLDQEKIEDLLAKVCGKRKVNILRPTQVVTPSAGSVSVKHCPVAQTRCILYACSEAPCASSYSIVKLWH